MRFETVDEQMQLNFQKSSSHAGKSRHLLLYEEN
jgi:hypothetical protein